MLSHRDYYEQGTTITIEIKKPIFLSLNFIRTGCLLLYSKEVSVSRMIL